MTIRHAIWRVGAAPEPLQAAVLTSEAQLEDMIVAAPSILHDNWMLIGRQIDTGFGGRLDLLAIAPDGALVLIELKRDRTPRDVNAQAIDYATIAIVPSRILSEWRDSKVHGPAVAELGRDPGGHAGDDVGTGWFMGSIPSSDGRCGSHANGVDRGEDCKRHTQGGCTVELPAERVRKHGLISID